MKYEGKTSVFLEQCEIMILKHYLEDAVSKGDLYGDH